jgi:hypothetical protein
MMVAFRDKPLEKLSRVAVRERKTIVPGLYDERDFQWNNPVEAFDPLILCTHIGLNTLPTPFLSLVG